MARASPADAADLAKLLNGSKLGRYALPLSKLSHTESGRPLHQAGVATLLSSLETSGWLGSQMTVCLVGDVPDEGLNQDNAAGRQYLVVNGNHRLAALRRFYENKSKAAGETLDLGAHRVDCEVHTGLNDETQKLVASSEWCCVQF